MIKYISAFIAICIGLFSCLVNVGIGLFFAFIAYIYTWDIIAYFILFITLVYTIYDGIGIYKETEHKIYRCLK